MARKRETGQEQTCRQSPNREKGDRIGPSLCTPLSKMWRAHRTAQSDYLGQIVLGRLFPADVRRPDSNPAMTSVTPRERSAVRFTRIPPADFPPRQFRSTANRGDGLGFWLCTS